MRLLVWKKESWFALARASGKQSRQHPSKINPVFCDIRAERRGCWEKGQVVRPRSRVGLTMHHKVNVHTYPLCE
jgi:hypothetical protein